MGIEGGCPPLLASDEYKVVCPLWTQLIGVRSSETSFGDSVWHHNGIWGVMELVPRNYHKLQHYGAAFYYKALYGGHNYNRPWE